MTRRRESQQRQWERIVALVERCRQSAVLSLADAQQRFDAAPDLALSDQFVRSVVSQVLHGRSEQLQATACQRLGMLQFSADAFARAETLWGDAPCWIVIEPDRSRIDLATVVRSDDLNVTCAADLRPAGESVLDWSPTEAVVYDVWADWRGSGRGESRPGGPGVLRWDVYQDGRDLSTVQFGVPPAWWRDNADHRRESRARVRDN